MKIKNVVFASLLMSAMFVAGCQNGTRLATTGKAEQELPVKVQNKMKALGMPKTSPILVRLFKEESALEIWKQKSDGRYGLIATYDICKWSGKLGPKYIEGDRQAPEGFYLVRPAQMNPNSNYYLSFNIGFPNAYDQVNGRTGQHLMVHGACSSSGCYSMTDESIAQIYAFGRDSFKGGQREFQVQAFPFRMTAANMARYRKDPNYPFWTMLKEGYDIFEASKVPPKVDVCERRYVFNRATPDGQPLSPAGICPVAPYNPSATMAYASYQKKYNVAFAAATRGSGKKPAPSIAGMEEANLVADWSRRRARGEKVTREPPSLTPGSKEIPGAPDIASPNAYATRTAPSNVGEGAVTSTNSTVLQPDIRSLAEEEETYASPPTMGLQKEKRSWIPGIGR